MAMCYRFRSRLSAELKSQEIKSRISSLIFSPFGPTPPSVPPSRDISAVVDEFDVAHGRIRSNGTSAN